MPEQAAPQPAHPCDEMRAYENSQATTSCPSYHHRQSRRSIVLSRVLSGPGLPRVIGRSHDTSHCAAPGAALLLKDAAGSTVPWAEQAFGRDWSRPAPRHLRNRPRSRRRSARAVALESPAFRWEGEAGASSIPANADRAGRIGQARRRAGQCAAWPAKQPQRANQRTVPSGQRQSGLAPAGVAVREPVSSASPKRCGRRVGDLAVPGSWRVLRSHRPRA
jgi:hypothetical protein